VNLEQHKGYWVRPGTLDKYIVDELPGYGILPLKANDRVLDVGGCIGSYARWAAGLAEKVWTYEPMPDNFAVLKKNVAGLANVSAHQLAVTTSEDEVIPFYVNVGLNKGAHSVIPTRGRQVIHVRTERWRHIMAKLKPTKIKMDCEGAEYDLLQPPLNKHVQGLVIEYHLTKTGQRAAACELHERLIIQGFDPIREPILNTGAWTAFAAYKRVK
jgi:FkbM family methyltransferase